MENVVNIHEAKTHLSRLVDDVAAGAEVVIAKSGKPMARLVPLENRPGARPSGCSRAGYGCLTHSTRRCRTR